MFDVKNFGFAVIAMIAVQGCTPPVPASNAGPGFNDYAQFELERAQREAALNGSGTTAFEAPAQVQTGAIGQVPAVSTGGIASSDLAAAGIGGSAPSVANAAPMSAMGTGSGLAPFPAASAALPAPATNNVGISDEQDFDAVASRESIESDAQRRAQQAATREQIMPTAVPTRSATAGPNIVEYALSAPNRKGQEWYSRSIFSTKAKFERNCVEFSSADGAQRAFLERGGPDRDPLGVDPDGDGFACGWDPAPFLAAAGR